MGACRQNRPSEESFDIVLREIRSMDKMLWNGDKYFIKDVEQSIRVIKQRLDCVIEQFKKEVKMDEVYTCACGGQEWSIHDSFIRCCCCQKEYKTDNECPSKFNEKIKKSGK